MFTKKLDANVLLIALMSLSAVLLMLFSTQDKWIHQEKLATAYYQRYLENKIGLLQAVKKEENLQCQSAKSQRVSVSLGNVAYQFYCEQKTLFIGKLPTKKYHAFDPSDLPLNLDLPNLPIYRIHSLAELPASSQTDPKIVFAEGDIRESLHQHFYGIIITHSHFEIIGANKKIYGMLYSSFDNEREERSLTFNKTVIANLAERYALWQPLPYSRNLLNAN